MCRTALLLLLHQQVMVPTVRYSGSNSTAVAQKQRERTVVGSTPVDLQQERSSTSTIVAVVDDAPNQQTDLPPDTTSTACVHRTCYICRSSILP